MSVEQAACLLKERLPADLFSHCAAVAETAAGLAIRLGCDPQKARLAGWLHDCARGMTAKELLGFAEANNLPVDEYSRRQPILLHAPVGEVLARQWGFIDLEVLSAIRRHTLGAPGLTLLERIIYVADKIEPNRAYPGVEDLRQRVSENFYAGLLEAAAQTIRYILDKRQLVHPLTIDFWNWLLDNPDKE